LIIYVITYPAVSIPTDKGITSTKIHSLILSLFTPLKIAAYTAAPYATHSSGLMDLFNYLPLKYSDNNY